MNLNEEVTTRLQEILEPEAEISFKDPSDDGRHFLLKITSEKFANKSRIERSRMIYAVLDDLISSDTIHALRLELKTPQE
jgi:stress-induced morphogen